MREARVIHVKRFQKPVVENLLVAASSHATNDLSQDDEVTVVVVECRANGVRQLSGAEPSDERTGSLQRFILWQPFLQRLLV